MVRMARCPKGFAGNSIGLILVLVHSAGTPIPGRVGEHSQKLDLALMIVERELPADYRDMQDLPTKRVYKLVSLLISLVISVAIS
jgi:hypothetical protein